MSARTQKSAEVSFARWQKNCAAIEARGDLKPELWPNGCGRCGGDLEIRPYIEAFSGSDAPNTKTINVCQVCQVDRVKRWGDMMQASAIEGRELRAFPGQPTARALSAAGLVKYNREDLAWELTDEGAALLKRWDAPEWSPVCEPVAATKRAEGRGVKR